ncbi:hypothetical protein JXA34_00635 [Patescibacteria group bacterium]|nr:hypothetical protein [Patescibacteria group bacterium]
MATKKSRTKRSRKTKGSLSQSKKSKPGEKKKPEKETVVDNIMDTLARNRIKKELIIDLIYLAVVTAALLATKGFGLWDILLSRF